MNKIDALDELNDTFSITDTQALDRIHDLVKQMSPKERLKLKGIIQETLSEGSDEPRDFTNYIKNSK